MAVFVFLLSAASCQSQRLDNTNTLKVADANKVSNNWICIPGEKVGLIKKFYTEADIIKAYGVDNVTRRVVGYGEGWKTNATIVYPDTKNELVIFWNEEKHFELISSIRISHPDSPWITNQGIKVGTTLEELVEVNGKNFYFRGFGWDSSGYSNSWDGGAIPQSLVVILASSLAYEDIKGLMGDGSFPSNHSQANGAGIHARMLIFPFPGW